MNKSHYTVSELIANTRKVLELSFQNIWVDGEISNLHYHSSGHIYFTLKDSEAEVKCAMFKRSAMSLRFQLEEGMRIIVYGSVSVFEARGQLQFIVNRLEVSGVGALYQAFETLKIKLESKGYFSPENKTAINPIPQKIGIITSDQGAALSDMINVIKRRSPFLNIKVSSVRVQGEGAAEDISNAIIELSKDKDIETIIIGRGGGSIEDLWAFNEEILAQTIYECNTPIISAVGHETDYTIADFVADVRAATPSVAAEIICLSKNEIYQRLESINTKMLGIVEDRLRYEYQKLENMSDNIGALQPLNKIKHNKALMKYSYNTIIKIITEKLNNANEKLISHKKYLENLGPSQVLSRGYSIAIDKKTNKIIRSSKMIKKGGRFYLRTNKGSLEAEKLSNVKI